MRRLCCSLLATLCVASVVSAEPLASESSLAIEEAITLLEARKEQLPLAEDKRVVDAAVTSLREQLRPQAEPDHKKPKRKVPRDDAEPSKPTALSPAKLRARFGGKAALNPSDSTLTLVYSFAAKNEVKDFVAGGSALRVQNGFLKLDPGDEVKHVVHWKSVTMTCDIEVNQWRGTAVSTTSGFALVGAGFFAEWIHFQMPNGEKSEVNLQDAIRRGRFPLRLELTPTRAMAAYAGAKVGKAFNVESVGQVALRGGDVGYGFSRLTMVGVADPEWLADFVDDKDAK